MQKIVINKQYGGFSLNDDARLRLFELSEGQISMDAYEWDIPRDHPALIQVIEELGEAAGDPYSTLAIVEVPDGINWTIEEYDGNEWIAEVHRTWD